MCLSSYSRATSPPCPPELTARRYAEADTICILVATDNHVGYAELDPIRKEDSWRSFDEVMSIARERDVDMVLLAGDLFHDNSMRNPVSPALDCDWVKFPGKGTQ